MLGNLPARCCISEVDGFGESKDDEERAGTDECCGNPVDGSPAVVDTDQSSDDDTTTGSS